MAEEKLVKRSQKLAFYGVKKDQAVTYHRMTGFTEFSKNANPKEYSRRYIDEEYERNDIVGYSPAFSYEFDQFTENPVHGDIAAVTDGELTGSDAVRSLVVVDLTAKGSSGGYAAVKRDFSIIPDQEGGSMDAYTYSGSMKAAGEKIVGTATSTDDWKTLTFTDAKG